MTDSSSRRLSRVLAVFRYSVAATILVFGVASTHTRPRSWMIFSIAMYAIPLASQLSRRVVLRNATLWLGLFLVCQALLSPHLQSDFKTLPPDSEWMIDVRGGMPGISGVQHMATDRLGFKVATKVDYESDDSFRIFAIGGSTTEQRYVGNANTWCALLKQELETRLRRDVDVVNTGMSGLRAQHHLATLKRILQYHPDMVVILLGINDWNRQACRHLDQQLLSPREKIRRWFKQYGLQDTLLGTTLRLVRFRWEGRGEVVSKVDYGEYYTGQRGSLFRAAAHPFNPKNVSPEYAETLQSISEVCHQHQVTCLWLTQPTGYDPEASEEFRAGFWMTPPNRNYTLDFDSLTQLALMYNTYTIDFARNNGHLCLDLAAQIPPSFEYFIDDCHFNLKGSQRVTQLIADFVVDRVFPD